MAQLDNLDFTLHRLEEEMKWNQRKRKRFVEWLMENEYIKPGQRPGQRVVENLFKKIQTFEEKYKEETEYTES